MGALNMHHIVAPGQRSKWEPVSLAVFKHPLVSKSILNELLLIPDSDQVLKLQELFDFGLALARNSARRVIALFKDDHWVQRHCRIIVSLNAQVSFWVIKAFKAALVRLNVGVRES